MQLLFTKLTQVKIYSSVCYDRGKYHRSKNSIIKLKKKMQFNIAYFGNFLLLFLSRFTLPYCCLPSVFAKFWFILCISFKCPVLVHKTTGIETLKVNKLSVSYFLHGNLFYFCKPKFHCSF